MDPLKELERMALNVEGCDQQQIAEPTADEIARWQELFGYSYAEALGHIEDQRNDVARERVTDDHWELVKKREEEEGYDREAYEHKLRHKIEKRKASPSGPCASPTAASQLATVLVKLEGPLDSADQVMVAANLSSPPKIVEGTNVDGSNALFCRINAVAKVAIQSWLLEKKHFFEPFFVFYSKARKELSDTSAYPTLGIDTTLPQYRTVLPSPTQMQYPVWYFFYGTLADPNFLCGLLEIQDAQLEVASVDGGTIKTWQGKYKALVDGPDTVPGYAFQVMSQEHEEALMLYETDAYEVVRCQISLHGWSSTVTGCTFRFVDQTRLQ